MSVKLTEAQEQQSRTEDRELREMGLYPIQQFIIDNAYQDATHGEAIVWDFETGKCMVLSIAAAHDYTDEHRWAHVVANK